MVVRDHEGTVFPSLVAMCRHWGVPCNNYMQRLCDGWTQEEALTVKNAQEVQDHEGAVYESFTEMCRQYGMSRGVVYERLQQGWDLKSALTTSVQKRTGITVILSTGEVYQSMAEFARENGLSHSIVQYMRKKGHSFDEILEMHRKPVIDPSGVEHLSVAKMSVSYGVDPDTYDRRIAEGWTQEEALGLKKRNRNYVKVKLEDGREYDSIIEFAQSNGLSRSTVKFRRAAGYSFDEILKMGQKRRKKN